ncbi:MAG: TonB family protein [Candidatus Aminicenantes bacterium]|nr:TonB family protein [Candidatus Aminicenantes bacterium]
MMSSLYEDYLGPGSGKRFKKKQAAGLAATLIVHALILFGAVKARFEVKMLPVEKKTINVHLGPRVNVGLPADYEKHLADLDLLESGGDAYWGEIGRRAGRGGRRGAESGPASPAPSAAESGPDVPEAVSGTFALAYRIGSEKKEIPDFDLRPPAAAESAEGARSAPSTSDPRLKSYPSTDIRAAGGGEGYALARSTFGDRVVYRGRLPAGVQSAALTAWGRRVVESVQKRWVLPLSAKEGSGGQVALTVIVEKDGRASLVRINASSRIALLDRSAVSAVTDSLPFPSLPEGFPGRNLETFFLFDCHEK